MIGKTIGTVGILAITASMVSAATISNDGAYFNWQPTVGGITTGAAITNWDNLNGGSTGGASGMASWSLGTLGGQTAAILTDNSSERYAQAVKSLPATGGTLPTATDFDYYTQFGFYLSSASPRSGTGTLVYREWNTDIKYNPITMLMNATNQKFTVNGKNLQTSLGTSYVLPIDTWVTFTVHRLNELQYTITAKEGTGADKELGWDSSGSFSLIHNAVIGTGVSGASRYQLGTGMAWSDNAQIGYSFFKIGEAIPEPASLSLLGLGGLLLTARRRQA